MWYSGLRILSVTISVGIKGIIVYFHPRTVKFSFNEEDHIEKLGENLAIIKKVIVAQSCFFCATY